MKRSNQIMEHLKDGPKTNSELPYKFGGSRLTSNDRSKVRLIKVQGRKEKKGYVGQFKCVYYLAEDEDRAILKFIEVNKKRIENMDLSRSKILQTGLAKGIGKKIVDKSKEIKSQNL